MPKALFLVGIYVKGLAQGSSAGQLVSTPPSSRACKSSGRSSAICPKTNSKLNFFGTSTCSTCPPRFQRTCCNKGSMIIVRNNCSEYGCRSAIKNNVSSTAHGIYQARFRQARAKMRSWPDDPSRPGLVTLEPCCWNHGKMSQHPKHSATDSTYARKDCHGFRAGLADILQVGQELILLLARFISGLFLMSAATWRAQHQLRGSRPAR